MNLKEFKRKYKISRLIDWSGWFVIFMPIAKESEFQESMS
jgi:hypothetical protein